MKLRPKPRKGCNRHNVQEPRYPPARRGNVAYWPLTSVFEYPPFGGYARNSGRGRRPLESALMTPMRLLPRQLAYRVCDLRRVIGLGKETAALRKVVFAYQITARGHYYLDGRPAVADGMSEFETVYGAWHVNIREDYANVAAVLEYPYCFVSVCSFNNLEARILYRSDGTKANQWFIFDDKDSWCFSNWVPHAPCFSPRCVAANADGRAN